MSASLRPLWVILALLALVLSGCRDAPPPPKQVDNCPEPNACGGCEALAGVPGEACGPCGDGLFVCVSPNDVGCSGQRDASECPDDNNANNLNNDNNDNNGNNGNNDNNGVADDDGDGVVNADDNCPEVANQDQLDGDRDGRGDACDDDPTQRNFVLVGEVVQFGQRAGSETRRVVGRGPVVVKGASSGSRFKVQPGRGE